MSRIVVRTLLGPWVWRRACATLADVEKIDMWTLRAIVWTLRATMWTLRAMVWTLRAMVWTLRAMVWTLKTKEHLAVVGGLGWV